MKVEKLGEGRPELAILHSVHGDESCGRKAVERFKQSGIELEKPVEIVTGNPKASRQGRRYVDRDLNRCFPGKPDSKVYEERVAYQLSRHLEGKKVLDLHSSESEPTPFGIIVDRSLRNSGLVEAAGVSRVVDFSAFENAKIPGTERLAVECGNPGTEAAAYTAHQKILDFLSFHGAIERKVEEQEPEIYEVYEKVDGGNYSFLEENFSLVEKGQVYAENGSIRKVAEEDFYPVLMSEGGYEKIIGFKARKL